MKAFIGGAWRDVQSGTAYINGAWRKLIGAKAYVSGAWRDIVTFVLPLSLTNSGDFSGFSSSSTVTSDCSATPTGGLAPYTYSWVVVTSANATFSLFNAATASVTVMATGVARVTPATCTVRCTVTDNLGTVATSTANGILTNEGSFGGGGGGTL